MFFKSTAPMSEGEPASAPVVSDVVPELVVEPAKPTSRKVKAYGKEIEVREDEVDKYLSLGVASTQKFEEAKKIQEEAQKILSLKGEKSAMKTLLAQGYTREEAREILENDLRATYEEDELSPEEKARKAEKAELDRYKAEEAARKQAIEDEARSKEEHAYLTRLDEEIAQAVEKSGLPKHPILGKMAINYMASFGERGIDLSAADAMKHVASDWDQIITSVFSEMDAKSVKKYLKADHVKGLREEALIEYQAKQKPFDKPAVASKQAPAPSEKDNAPKRIRSNDFFK